MFNEVILVSFSMVGNSLICESFVVLFVLSSLLLRNFDVVLFVLSLIAPLHFTNIEQRFNKKNQSFFKFKLSKGLLIFSSVRLLTCV